VIHDDRRLHRLLHQSARDQKESMDSDQQPVGLSRGREQKLHQETSHLLFWTRMSSYEPVRVKMSKCRRGT